MVNSGCGTKPHLDKFKDNQPEHEAVQFKDPDKEVSVNTAEQEDVSGPVGIFSLVTQDNAVSNRLQSTELALETANLHKNDTALIEVLLEVKQDDETEEHNTGIKNEPQDQQDSEGPVIKLLGDLDKVENRNRKTTSSPEPQTSHKDQSSPNHDQEHSLDVNGDGMLFQEMEETRTRMDPNTRDDHPERISATTLEHLEETCFNIDIHLQASEETETLEPPTKKRLRRRMGMCGLGDRKRKFPFDGQHCSGRQGLTGRQREEGAGKGNEGAEHTVLKNDTTPMDHEGRTRPACKGDEEVLKDMKNNVDAVMDDERKGEVEKENSYAPRNMSKCTALMNDEVTTENKNILKKGILQDDDCIITMGDKGTAEQIVLEHEVALLENTSTGVGQTLLSPTTGKNVNMIQHESAVAAATKHHEMETDTWGDEPNFPGPDITSNGQDIEFNMKHAVLSEKPYLHADNKVHEDLDEIATEVGVALEVSSVCATVEMSEGPVIVTKEVQEVPSGLEESEMEMEEKHPLSAAAAEKLGNPNGNDLSGSTEKGLHPLFVDSMDVAAMASSEIHNAKNNHGENDKPFTAVSENTAHAGGDANGTKGIGEPIVPPVGQKNHMHCLLDHDVCDTSVTPSVAEQQVCNPTLTPAANELSLETCVGLSSPSLLYSVTDSQIHKIALSMELEDQPIPEGCDQLEDATELVRGLIRELSSLNRTVMAAHREMELVRRGKLQKAPNRRTRGPRHTEM